MCQGLQPVICAAVPGGGEMHTHFTDEQIEAPAVEITCPSRALRGWCSSAIFGGQPQPPPSPAARVQVFYNVERLNLRLRSWATKDLKLMECFCFQTNLVFLKNLSEAALMADISGRIAGQDPGGTGPLCSDWGSRPPGPPRFLALPSKSACKAVL